MATSKRFKRTGLPPALRDVYVYGQTILDDTCDVIASGHGKSYDGLEKKTLIRSVEDDFRLATEKAKIVLAMPEMYIDPKDTLRIAKLSFVQEAAKNIKRYGDYAARFDYRARFSNYMDELDSSYQFPDFNEISDGRGLNHDETMLAALHIFTYTQAIGNRGRSAQSYVDHLGRLAYSLNRDHVSQPLFQLMESGLTALKDRMKSPLHFPNAVRSN